jgi:NAD(P)-dependent dehydrogenase (short-subunit alcohol dehydrogenase family)
MAKSAAARSKSRAVPPARTAVVFGVGAATGLGAALARRFAHEGLRVFVVGRTKAKVSAVADKIQQAGGKAEARVADVTHENDVIALLEEASANASLDLVAYNVGNNVAVPLLDLSTEVFETAWRQNGLGGFIVGREAVRRMLPQGHGTLLFTGATASLRARPPFTAFAAAKASLRALAQGIAREFGPRGLHVAHIVIDGVIEGDYAKRRFPDFVKAKGKDGLLKVDEIADAYWALHSQPKSTWTHELDLRPFKELF